MSQHTSGPWRRTNLTIHTAPTADRPALVIARVLEAGIETEAANSVEQATANANLIAAAPALLEALEAVMAKNTRVQGPEQFADPADWIVITEAAFDKARAAIAQAKGQA